MQSLYDSTEQATPGGPLLSQYPSMLCIAVLPSGPTSPIRALLRCALLGLESRRSCGVHVVVNHSNAGGLSGLYDDVYLSAGFSDVSALWKRKDGSRVLGKQIPTSSTN